MKYCYKASKHLIIFEWRLWKRQSRHKVDAAAIVWRHPNKVLGSNPSLFMDPGFEPIFDKKKSWHAEKCFKHIYIKHTFPRRQANKQTNKQTNKQRNFSWRAKIVFGFGKNFLFFCKKIQFVLHPFYRHSKKTFTVILVGSV